MTKVLIAVWLCATAALLPGVVAAQVRFFVSVAPLAHIVERVGGDHVAVETLVQPGHSPVTYEPTTRQLARLASAHVYVRTGVPFETVWMDRIGAANPGLDIIDARDGIELLPMSETGEYSDGDAEHAHDHDGMDPHIWLDPKIVARIALVIRDYLVRVDPPNRSGYTDDAARFLEDLGELDHRISSLIAQARSRKFLVFHPAWGYFARAYGLEQLAVEHQGKAPGPRTLARLVERAGIEGIGSVFVQEQVSGRLAQTLADALGARVVVLDPLAADYFDNLLSAARAISGGAAR